MLNLSHMNNYERLSNNETGGLILLKENLETIYNCDVKLLVNPIKYFNDCGIDITKNPNRSVYRIENFILLLTKVMKDDNIDAVLGIRLSGNLILEYKNSDLEIIARTVTKIISDCYNQNRSFNHSIKYFDRVFVDKLICNYMAKGYYVESSFQYLLGVLCELSKMTFENEHFSTGFIISKEANFFERPINVARKGEVHKINIPFDIKGKNRLNKRLWKLVDGINSFYLFDKSLSSKCIYINKSDNSLSECFIDAKAMSDSLYGQDVAFRTFGHNQFSLTNSSKQEFVNIDNRWIFRDYDVIERFLLKELSFIDVDLSNLFISQLLFYIHYCSINCYSSIIWVPEDIDIISEVLVGDNPEKYFDNDISLFEEKYKAIFLRCITSDGITIVNKNGYLSSFGQIADISKANSSGISGTGETVTTLLATNGMAIKISSDGIIKLYSKNLSKYMCI